MGNVLILSPRSIAAVTTTRGSGGDNLITPSPKEVWVDVTDASAVSIQIDFGQPVEVDTVFLGFLFPPAAGARWTVQGNISGGPTQTFFSNLPLRAVDSASLAPATTHAFWKGAARTVRYMTAVLSQTAGAGALRAGVLMAGKAWQPQFNMEFGSGRRVIDTGTVASLPDGGFSIVPGARKRAFSWTLGDLSIPETDALEELLLNHGETVPLLVVADPDATTGQRNRIHYGLFTGLKAYERRNPSQTRFDFQFEEWI